MAPCNPGSPRSIYTDPRRPPWLAPGTGVWVTRCGTNFRRGSCRAHVHIRDGRRIFPVRRKDAPCGAPREQEIPFARPKASRRSRDDRNAAVADRGGHASLRQHNRSARASRALPPHARTGGCRTQARARRHGHLPACVLAGTNRDAQRRATVPSWTTFRWSATATCCAACTCTSRCRMSTRASI